jgi:ammonium transporter, Amt family
LGVSDGRGAIFGRAAMNTMIAGSSGALTVFIMNNFIKIASIDRWSLVMLCNGNLAGLVAVTGACNNIECWAAFTIGIIGGFTYLMIARVLYALKVDDPVDAIPIHLGCGILGANVVSWFDMDTGILYGHGGKQFGI